MVMPRTGTGDGRGRCGRPTLRAIRMVMAVFGRADWSLTAANQRFRNHGRRGYCEAPSGDARITDHSTNPCGRTASLESQHRADITRLPD
jgi:hypothetical protein